MGAVSGYVSAFGSTTFDEIFQRSQLSGVPER
jgi:hypothetical protein